MAKSKERIEKVERGFLFAPLIFSYGATVENVSLSEYLRNPTKIVRALKNIHQYFRTDVIVSWLDPELECKLLGYKAKSNTVEMYEIKENFQKILPEGLSEKTEIQLILDVVNRLNILLKDVPLMLLINGPINLTSKLIGINFENIKDIEKSLEIIEIAKLLTLEIIRSIGPLDVDILILNERLPKPTERSMEVVEDVYSTILNTLKYFGINTGLMIDVITAEHSLYSNLFDCLIINDIQNIEPLLDFKRLGFALPLNILHKSPEEIEIFFGEILDKFSFHTKPFMVTTEKEIPPYASPRIVRGLTIIRELMGKFGDVR